MSYLTAFHNKLDNFFNDLEQSFPDVTDIFTLHELTKTLLPMNPRRVLVSFMLCTFPYYKQILNKDERRNNFIWNNCSNGCNSVSRCVGNSSSLVIMELVMPYVIRVT